MTIKTLPSKGVYGYESSTENLIKIKVDNNGVVNTT